MINIIVVSLASLEKMIYFAVKDMGRGHSLTKIYHLSICVFIFDIVLEKLNYSYIYICKDSDKNY